MPDNSETSANFAGVEIAGTTMRAVTVSSDGTVVAQREVACEPDDLVPQIANLVSGLRELGPLNSVGVAIPGLVKRDTDRVLSSTDLRPAVHGNFHSNLMKATLLRAEIQYD